MADSRQLDILKRLTVQLQGIVPANGYDFDLSDSVFRGRRRFGATDADTVLSIVEHLQGDINVDVAGHNSIMRREDWILLIQGWLLPVDGEAPTDEAYQLKAAVEHRMARCITMNPRTGNPMYPDEYMLGVKDTITGMAIGPGVVSVDVRDDANARAFFYLPIGIGLAVDVSDPFLPEG